MENRLSVAGFSKVTLFLQSSRKVRANGVKIFVLDRTVLATARFEV